MEQLTKEILQELAKPFPASKIGIKIQTKPNENGKALCVAYIDARDVMQRLDDVVGGDWGDSYRKAETGGLECSLTVCGVTRVDVGKDDNDNEQEKSSYSDAFKRAGVKFGIGRFLYDLPKMYAQTKQVGKNSYLADGEEARLRAILHKALTGETPKSTVTKSDTETTIETTSKPQPITPALLVKAGLAENDFAGKAIIDGLGLVGKDVAIGLVKACLYRKLRDTGKESAEAFALTLSNSYPAEWKDELNAAYQTAAHNLNAKE